MSTILDNLSERISTRVRFEREARKWSLADLASHSSVSKAMISKIERGESSPTTAVLGRLCGAFGITLSTFLSRAEDTVSRLIRASEQPSWADPETGCLRTLVSPNTGGPIEMVTADLPAGEEIAFPASLYSVFHQLVWVLEGQLTLTEGESQHLLTVGDCLEFGPPTECVFRNDAREPCRYLVASSRRQ